MARNSLTSAHFHSHAEHNVVHQPEEVQLECGHGLLAELSVVIFSNVGSIKDFGHATGPG